MALVAVTLGMTGSGCSQGDAAEKIRFKKFERIYEPSGVQQLTDGRFLVVQDESTHPFDIVSLQQSGKVVETSIYRSSLFSWASSNRALSSLEDLEAVASDNEGYIYAITSHSRKESGKRDNAREQLVRFRLDGEQSTDVQIARGLRKWITKKHPALKQAVKLRDVKEDGGFNIEGLSFDAQKNHLLIGLRGPRTESDEAIIVTLENPKELFNKNVKPRISDQLIKLDLRGGTIRGLAYDPHLDGYLILSRRTGKSFRLWYWSGDTENKPQRITIKGVKNLQQAEGVTPVHFDGQPKGILLVSDDGDGLTQKAGRYLFVDYQQLSIKSLPKK